MLAPPVWASLHVLRVADKRSRCVPYRAARHHHDMKFNFVGIAKRMFIFDNRLPVDIQ